MRRSPPHTVRITLVRHGRSALRTNGLIRSASLRDLLRDYERAGIRPRPAPAPELLRKAKASGIVACSDARRSVDSARVLDRRRRVLVDPVFREAGLPERVPIPLRLSAEGWALVSRAIWLGGWLSASETVWEALSRGRRAARRLDELALRHRSVVLVGHGMFNTFISLELRRLGWNGSLWSPFSANWAHATFWKRPAANESPRPSATEGPRAKRRRRSVGQNGQTRHGVRVSRRTGR